MRNLIKDSAWIGVWVRYHDREGKMVITPVVDFESVGAGGIDILHTSLDEFPVNEVMEKRSPDDFDIEALKRKTTAEVASRLIKLLEDYRSELEKTRPAIRFSGIDAALITIIEQVTVEYLRGETNA